MPARARERATGTSEYGTLECFKPVLAEPAMVVNARALLVAGLCAGLLIAHSSATAASFDCGRASTEQERRICASPALSVLDEVLASAYADARERMDPDLLKRDQRVWLKYWRNACQDDACLARAYADRLLGLAAMPQIPEFSGLYSRSDEACFVANNDDGVACEGEAESSIYISPAGRDRAWIEVSLWFFNGHSCSFSGAARLQDGIWRAVHVESDSELSCALELHRTDSGLRTEASEDCRMYCGARGSLQQIELPRTQP
jgi:uncharacterized protein